MDAAPKPVLGDATNASPPPAAKPPPRPAADKPRRVVTWYDPTKLPPPRAAALLPLAPCAPPKPKGVVTALVFYGIAKREEIKAEHPDWKLGDVGRELNKRWKALDDAAKKPFHDLEAADKLRYEAEKAAYEAYEAANQPAPVVVAKSAPPVPPPRKRKNPPTIEVPIDEDQDWTPKNNGKQLVNLWTGKPVEKPRDKKVDCSDDSEIEDDGAPKMKKQSGYLNYCAQNREAAKAAVESDPATAQLGAQEKSQAVLKKLGEMWGALDAAAKQKCRDDAPMVAVKPKKKKKKKKTTTTDEKVLVGPDRRNDKYRASRRLAPSDPNARGAYRNYADKIDPDATAEYIPKLQKYLKQQPGGDAMAKKVAGWGAFRVRRNTHYVDRVANKCYRSVPEIEAALTAEASA